MRIWLLAIAAQIAILAIGFGSMGVDFTAVSVLDAPLVNLLLWTCLISLTGLAASVARRRMHRWLTRTMLIGAIAWFPVSLLIFGNARFSGTTDFLWQAWIIGSATLIIGTLLSLASSAASGLWSFWRIAGQDDA